MSNVLEGNVWQGFVRSIKSKLSQESFNTWFQPLSFEGLDESERVLRLGAPNAIIRNWVTANYSALIDESLAEVSLHGYLIGWSTIPQSETAKTSAEVITPGVVDNQIRPEAKVASIHLTPASTNYAAVGQKRALQSPALNPKYTYDSFVVGSCNQFAHAASSAVADAPGKTYNP